MNTIPKKQTIIIVVPCYNCTLQAQRVALSIDNFVSEKENTSFQISKVLFIDNLSSDSTYQSLFNLFPKLKSSKLFHLEKNSKNIGLGGTHKKALQILIDEPYDFLVFLHGDNQADIKDLNNLLKLSEDHNFCTVLGSRFMDKRYLHNYSAFRRIGNQVLNLIYSSLLKRKIYDLGSGLNLFAKRDFQGSSVFHHFDNGFTFNMDLLIFLIDRNLPFIFVPIHWKSIDEKSNASSIKVGLKTLFKIFLWKFWGDKMWYSRSMAR